MVICRFCLSVKLCVRVIGPVSGMEWSEGVVGLGIFSLLLLLFLLCCGQSESLVCKFY